MKVNNYTKNKFDNKSDNTENHFRELTKMVKTSTKVTDYTESIFDNIRKIEILEKKYLALTEDEKRLCKRNMTKKGNPH